MRLENAIVEHCILKAVSRGGHIQVNAHPVDHKVCVAIGLNEIAQSGVDSIVLIQRTYPDLIPIEIEPGSSIVDEPFSDLAFN